VYVCREYKTLVLRPKAFDNHHSHYIVRYSRQAGAAGDYRCWRVPLHLQEVHWRQLLQQHSAELQREQLVLLGDSSQVLAVLGKLEEQKFIHCYAIGSESFDSVSTAASNSSSSGGSSSGGNISYSMPRSDSTGSGMSTSDSEASNGPSSAMSLDSPAARGSISDRQQAGSTAAQKMLFELPRYGLEFVLQGNYLLSRNYSGYRLRSRQLLVEQQPQQQQPGSSAGEASGGAAAESNSDSGDSSSSGGVRYSLADFQQYLVLERLPGAEAQPDKAAVLLVVPAGQVQPSWSSSSGRVRVALASSCDAELKVRS
jgi:hypothetical protein